MERSGSELDLPGFRFHPTEEELLDYYLRRAAHGKKLHLDIIGTLNLYRHDPCDLPGLAKIGEREWYFFVPRDRKQGNGGRPSRTTERGFWKATGTDRPVRSAADPRRLIGLKKTLVYYLGRAPRGSKTEWVMNEYRLPDDTTTTSAAAAKEGIVLCKVYRKAASMKELEQRAAMEEEMRASQATAETAWSSDQENFENLISGDGGDQLVVETEVAAEVSARLVDLAELQIPKDGLEWGQDPFLTQIRSPWTIEQWSPYANLLNF